MTRVSPTAADRNHLPARGIVPRRKRKKRLIRAVTVIDDSQFVLGQEETVSDRARSWMTASSRAKRSPDASATTMRPPARPIATLPARA